MSLDLVSTAISALVGGVIVALAWAVTALRQRISDQSAKLADLATANADLLKRLSNLERVDRNPLYREALEDQRALEIRAADSVAVGIEHMTNALRILSPELFKKKGKAK